MSKQITFRAYWEVFSDVTVDLPDNIDPDDKDAVNAFVQETWDGMELPENSEYLMDSDEVDYEHGFTITDKK